MSVYYLLLFIPANASKSQPEIKNNPPIGVIGPSHLIFEMPINPAVDSKYKEPEKSIIPIIKQ